MAKDAEIIVRADGRILVIADKTPVELTPDFPLFGRAAEHLDNTVSSGLEPVVPGPVAQPKAAKIGGVHTDARHPYVVFMCGVPLFASSSKVPERVIALIGSGISKAAFIILDSRSGQKFTLDEQGV